MRLDKFLSTNGYAESRNRALILLEKGCVTVNGKNEKASYEVKETDNILVTEPIKYVSMGGYKLEKALKDFNISIKNKTCADIGCSKGGFTQCLLNEGAKKVYALDVNLDELDLSLKNDKRVSAIQINAREMDEKTFGKVDFLCVDCSFISVKYIINNLISVLNANGEMVILLKPQFECGEKNLTKKGIVKNKSILKIICQEYCQYFFSLNLFVKGFTNAPIRENKNIEFLFYLTQNKMDYNINKINSIIDEIK